MLVDKLEGKRPLGIPRLIWNDNIKTDLKGIELEDADCIHLTW
jgi:hypothetical protein